MLQSSNFQFTNDKVISIKSLVQVFFILISITPSVQQQMDFLNYIYKYVIEIITSIIFFKIFERKF